MPDYIPNIASPVWYGSQDFEVSTPLYGTVPVRVLYPALPGRIALPGHLTPIPPLYVGLGKYKLVFFLHGDGTTYQSWDFVLSELARSGYIVVIQGGEALNEQSQNPIDIPLAALGFMVRESPFKDYLDLTQTGVSGHSYGATAAAKFALTFGQRAVFASIAGDFNDFAANVGSIDLTTMTMPKLFMISSDAALDPIGQGFNLHSNIPANHMLWDMLPRPKHNVMFNEAGHYDYVPVGSPGLTGGGGRGLCSLVPRLTADFLASFFSKYMPPQVDDSLGVSDSLVLNPAGVITVASDTVDFLTGLNLIKNQKACTVTSSWDLPPVPPSTAPTSGTQIFGNKIPAMLYRRGSLMRVADNERLIEAYRKLRSEQSANALAAQLKTFTGRVCETSRHVPAGLAGTASEERIRSLAFPTTPKSPDTRFPRFPRQNVFLVKSPPYTSGMPDPQQTTRTAGTASGAYFNIEAFGDPARGRLSVGVSAGITRDADWTGKTYYSQLPDRWLLGDAITSTASVLEIVDIPQGLASGSSLSAAVQFGWDPMYPGGFAGSTNLLLNSLENVAGLPNSAMGGFVGVSAMAELTVSLVSGDTILQSGQAFTPILQLGIDAQSYGDESSIDKLPAPYLFLDFAFNGNPWGIINLLAGASPADGAKQMFIETAVRLVGARGGVNDPNAGYVTAAFMDLYEGASPVSNVPNAPNPFVVNRITAFSTSLSR
jgi:hypothetical protein